MKKLLLALLILGISSCTQYDGKGRPAKLASDTLEVNTQSKKDSTNFKEWLDTLPDGN